MLLPAELWSFEEVMAQHRSIIHFCGETLAMFRLQAKLAHCFFFLLVCLRSVFFFLHLIAMQPQ